jgi:hypothetical protein
MLLPVALFAGEASPSDAAAPEYYALDFGLAASASSRWTAARGHNRISVRSVTASCRTLERIPNRLQPRVDLGATVTTARSAAGDKPG